MKFSKNLIVYFLICSKIFLGASQCCEKYDKNVCILCPAETHFFKNNCIFNLKGCLQYWQGFSCVKCDKGYQLNGLTFQCVLETLRYEQIPVSGFQALPLVYQNNDQLSLLKNYAQSEIEQISSQLDIYAVYARKSRRINYYRIIYYTLTGFLDTFQSITNIDEQGKVHNIITLLNKKIIQIQQDEVFVKDFSESLLQKIKTQVNLQYPELSKQTIIDIFQKKQEKEDKQVYRIFYADKDKGLIQIIIQLRKYSPGKDPNMIEKSSRLDLNNLQPQIIEGIIILRNQQPILNLFRFLTISKSGNNQQQQIYNATFLLNTTNLNSSNQFTQIQLYWIVFQIYEQNGLRVSILQLSPSFQKYRPLPLYPQCAFFFPQYKNIDSSIVFKQQLDLDIYIQDFKFQYFRSLLINCFRQSGGNQELLRIAMAENDTHMMFRGEYLTSSSKRQRVFAIVSSEKDQIAGTIIKEQLQIQELIYVRIDQLINITDQGSFNLDGNQQDTSSILQIIQEIGSIIEQKQIFKKYQKQAQLQEIITFRWLKENLIKRRFIFKYKISEYFREIGYIQYYFDVGFFDQQIESLPATIIPPSLYQNVQVNTFSEVIYVFAISFLPSQLASRIPFKNLISMYVNDQNRNQYLFNFFVDNFLRLFLINLQNGQWKQIYKSYIYGLPKLRYLQWSDSIYVFLQLQQVRQNFLLAEIPKYVQNNTMEYNLQQYELIYVRILSASQKQEVFKLIYSQIVDEGVEIRIIVDVLYDFNSFDKKILKIKKEQI